MPTATLSCGRAKRQETQSNCGAANLGRSRLLGGQSRLKAGCGQDCLAGLPAPQLDFLAAIAWLMNPHSQFALSA